MTAQIDEIENAIAEMKSQNGERFSIKQMEKTRKGLEARLEKLRATDRKDDVITFEQLGVGCGAGIHSSSPMQQQPEPVRKTHQ